MVHVDPINIEVANRLPLANSTLRLLQYVVQDDFVSAVFERHRARCFERDLEFSTFVRLIADSILGHRGSAHQTFQHAKEEQTLATSFQAVYARLATLPSEVSLAFFTEAAQRLDMVSICPANTLPVCTRGFDILALDGKKLKYVAKRLKALRGLNGNVLGGKLLVAQDVATRRVVAVEAAIDGETADNPLILGLLDRVRALPQRRPRLWLADRGFCDYNALPLFSQADDHFVVRHHAKCKFHADPTIAARTGVDDEGRPYREEWGWLGGPDNKKRVRVRMISVTHSSHEPFALVTSLFDADCHPAIELLTLYRSRWGIETMFQQLVQTFDLRHLIGGTAQATIFQAVLCMLLYNINLTICDFVTEGAHRPSSQSLSLHLLCEDTVEELTAWMKVIGPEKTANVLQATIFTSPEQLRDHLRCILKNIWTDRLTKAKTSKRPPRTGARAYLKGGHSSVDRIRRGVHSEIPIKRQTPT